MTQERRSKINGWTKAVVLALLSGGLSFFYGRVLEAGQYKERVDELARTVASHTADVRALSTNQATILEKVSNIEKKLDELKEGKRR